MSATAATITTTRAREVPFGRIASGPRKRAPRFIPFGRGSNAAKNAASDKNSDRGDVGESTGRVRLRYPTPQVRRDATQVAPPPAGSATFRLSEVALERGCDRASPSPGIVSPLGPRQFRDRRFRKLARSSNEPKSGKVQVTPIRPVRDDVVPVLRVPIRAVQVGIGPRQATGVDANQTLDPRAPTRPVGDIGQDQRVRGDRKDRARGRVDQQWGISWAEIGAPLERASSGYAERLTKLVLQRHRGHGFHRPHVGIRTISLVPSARAGTRRLPGRFKATFFHATLYPQKGPWAHPRSRPWHTRRVAGLLPEDPARPPVRTSGLPHAPTSRGSTATSTIFGSTASAS